MILSTALFCVTFFVSIVAVPVRRAVNPNLVVRFGIEPNTNPTGTGDCDGVKGIKIPCSCPPAFDEYVAALSQNVDAGHDVYNPGVPAPFPTDTSLSSQITRLQTQLSTLQNLHGPGVGCPAAATTWSFQLADLIAANSQPATAQDAPTSAAAPPTDMIPNPSLAAQNSSSPTVPAPSPTDAAPPGHVVTPAAATVAPSSNNSTLVPAELVVPFGVQRNTNPTGTGDCDGLNGIKIPCSCPPTEQEYLTSLSMNVANGHDVNNPTVCPGAFPDRQFREISDRETTDAVVDAAGKQKPVWGSAFSNIPPEPSRTGSWMSGSFDDVEFAVGEAHCAAVVVFLCCDAGRSLLQI
ncbi:hypothetical protein MKEN_00071100 [Mycena kentingensis (nom. inval.)]|nr:hypothetical protein MKEN_00071100 [Mycena kentingensis (nom. inval.)]